MSTIIEAPPSEAGSLEPPPVVYFWGPVRAHVNRAAAEYALRLDQEPVWLEVRSSERTRDEGADDNPVPPNRRFVLKAGRDVQLVSRPRVIPPAAGDAVALPPSDLEEQAGELLVFPPVVHMALRTSSQTGAQSAFVLSNIDRLQHLSPLLKDGMGKALLASFRERGIVLVLTSEGRLPLPPIDFECAFEIISSPEEKWWEAEVRPGVPVSTCSTCRGSRDGSYAACADGFRLACPIQVPFTEESA